MQVAQQMRLGETGSFPIGGSRIENEQGFQVVMPVALLS